MGELREQVGTRPLFSIGVSIVLLGESGEWLLQRRSDSGLWGLPGGGLEPGETFESAAARELEEETGLTGVILHRDRSVSGPECRHVYPHGDEVYLVGQLFRGVLSSAKFAEATLGVDGETLELRFFSLDALPALSGGIERQVARQLRTEAGLPGLPSLAPLPVAVPTPGDHLADLRALVGPRPLFAPGASVLVFDPQGRLLLLQHASNGLWSLPGGNLELGETLEQGARRALRAQTGVQAGRLEELTFYVGPDYRSTSVHGDTTDPVTMLYRAHRVTGTVATPPGLRWRWFAPDALHAAELLHGPLLQAMLKAAADL